MTNRKKIVVLAHSPSLGGAELALKALVNSLPEYEWAIVIPTNKPVDERIKNQQATYHYINLPWWCYEAHDSPAPVFSKQLFSGLIQLEMLAKDADFLVTNTLTVPWLGFISSRINKPHVWYVHEFGDIDHNLQFILGFEETLKVISRSSDRIITISNAVKDHLSSVISADKIDIIHQSIDFSKFIDLKPPHFTAQQPIKLLMMGAIKPSKGQHIAIAAFLQSATLSKKYSLKIVGPAANTRYTNELSDQVKNFPSVSLEVRSYTPEEELSYHDAVLMCSQNEGLGRVTLEAMAASRPVIGFSCRSTKELLKDGRGILYSPNTPKVLSGVLEKSNFDGFNTSTGKSFAVNNYNDVVQSSDFRRAIASSMDDRTKKDSSLLPGYIKTLNKLSLLIGPGQHIRRETIRYIKKLTPLKIKLLTKHVLKKR